MGQMIQAIAIEREFACGGSEIAKLLAQRLGWNLWDERLTQEIARLTKSSPEVVENIQWRRDPAVHRVFVSFLRGAFEGGLPPTNRLALVDARRIAAVSESAINLALSEGPCVIVGRGSQYFLRNRKDVFRTFLYASRDYKIHRLVCRGTPERDAIDQVDTTDRDRAAFVKEYLKLDWPEYHLYDAMFNTERGDSYVAEMLAYCAQQIASHEKISTIPGFG
jgi:cytidylate kinase